MFSNLFARVKKTVGVTLLTISAVNLPIYATNLTIHVRDGAGAIVTNATVYGLVYGTRGPDGSATQVQTVDGSGDAAFTLDPTKDYTFIASAQGKGPMARTQMMSSSAPRYRGDTTVGAATVRLAQDLSGRGKIHLTIQNGTPNSFLMANLHKENSNTDVQIGGCVVDGAGSDCTIDLHNVPAADADAYNVGVFDPNLFSGAGGGVGQRIGTAIASGDTLNVTLDLANAFPPNVSSAGSMRPDANNAVINVSLRSASHPNVTIPRSWIQLMSKNQDNNLNPNGGGQTDDAGNVQFRVAAGSYYIQTGFTCTDGNLCYDGVQPDPNNAADVVIVNGDLNTTVNKIVSVPDAPEGTGVFTVEVVKASTINDPEPTKIPYAGLNLGPDWSQWKTAAGGAPVCNGSDVAASNPGKTQKNVQASDGTALLQKITDGNYMLQAWTSFSQGGVPFNAGSETGFNWGNGLRGCEDQISDSAGNLRLTVSGATLKVYDTHGDDLSGTYVSVDGQGHPKIRIPVTTSADGADGLVHGTITFPEANNSLVSLTLYGQCDQNGCPGNFTSVRAGGQTSVTYSIHVPSTHNSNPADYYLQIKSDEYGPVFANGGNSQIRFQQGSTTVTQNLTMAKSGIVEGTLYNPDGSVFIPKNEPNSPHANINIQGEHSWGNADVDQTGHFRAVSILPGKYKLGVSIFGGSSLMTGKRPEPVITVSAGATTQTRADLVNAEFILPVWDVSQMPALSNQFVPNRGIKGETYNVVMTKADSQFDGSAIRSLLTHGNENDTFDYIPSANNQNRCGPTWVGWCGQYQPDGFNADYLAIRQGSLDRLNNRNTYMYMVLLQKKERVPIDPSKTSNPTVTLQSSPIKPIRVAFNPEYGGETVTISGTVKAEQMFRAIDFEKMGGDFEQFIQYIPLVTVSDVNGRTRAAGLVTPSAEFVGDEAENGDAIDQTIASGDFEAFKTLVKNWEWNFEIRGVPKAAKYLLSLTSPNYPALTKVISGQQDYSWLVDWDKDGSSGGTVSGVITDGAGTPLPSATVELRMRGIVKNVTTASNGTYKFEGLPLGRSKVTASAPDHAPRAKQTLITGTQTSAVDLALPASDATISGSVSKYAAVSGAFLKVPADKVKVLAYDDTFNTQHPSDPLAIIETETDDSGAYALAGAESAHVYKVSFKLDGYFVETLPVTAIVGNSTGNDVTLRKKGLQVKVKIVHETAEGRYVVSILNPNAFESGQVYMHPASQTFDSNTATDISGRFDQQPDGSLIGLITDAEVNGINQNLHIIATPDDGSPNVINDYAFGPSVSARVEQPIDDVLVAADGDNEVSGADGRTTVTVEPGALLTGNDDSTVPGIGLASHDQASLGGTTADDGQIIGDGVEVKLTNTQANPDRTIGISFPIDPNLVEGGVDPTKLEIYEQDSSGNWNVVTNQVTYDPVTGTVEGSINTASTVTQLPIEAARARGAMASSADRKPLSMAAIKTSNQIKKNPRASATTAGVFAVGLAASTTTAAATEYHQYNFPNPFNLADKTVTLRSGTSGVPAGIRGTYIVVAPTGNGSVGITIRIYNAAGDMVREFKDTANAGKYNYIHWDGKNTSGDDIASGVYFAVVDAPGAPKKEPIKLVVVK